MEASARETFRAMEVSNAIACSVAAIVFAVGAFTTKHQCSVAAPFTELAFGALKGALDGGLDIPHSEKRFAGFSKDSMQLDAEVHRKYIYGGHVAAYMRTLMEDEPEKYQAHFSEYVKRGIEADNIEELYKKAHAAIRADPAPKKSDKPVPTEHKRYNLKKLTYEERKAKLIERLNALNLAGAADDSEDDDRVH